MDILYHYCPNESFYSIISNNTIRLSSLTLSNDYLEGKLVSKLLSDLTKKDKLNINSTQTLLSLVNNYEERLHGLAFCLSEEGDLLSQWRGYAEDGAGVSIGFSKQSLRESLWMTCDYEFRYSANQFNFHLEPVVYEKDKQLDLIKPVYDKIIQKGTLSYPVENKNLSYNGDLEALRVEEKNVEELNRDIYNLIVSNSLLLKNEGFSEEREWRLILVIDKMNIHKECSFRAAGTKILPYRDYDQGASHIKEVLLGPKNKTPVYVIQNFLEQNDFKGVPVKKSIASYR